jgi:hypothetical protein
MTTPELTTYDPFDTDTLDEGRWQWLETTSRCVEPTAKTLVGGGTLEVSVQRFERAHDEVQIGDNPKHVMISTQGFALEPGTVATFSVDMAADNINGNPLDYRDGFASFNVLDMVSGTVWDHICTGLRAFAIHEKLFIPGVTTREESFTWVAEAPLHFQLQPGRLHTYTVEVDTVARQVRWYVDGQQVFEARDQEMPAEVRIGWGLITLHPIRNGRSTSLRDQGMVGRWSRFRYGSRPA